MPSLISMKSKAWFPMLWRPTSLPLPWLWHCIPGLVPNQPYIY